MSLLYRMGRAYNESYVNFSSKRRANFSNKVFTAWDFNITHPQSAKLRHAQIKTDFEVLRPVTAWPVQLQSSLPLPPPSLPPSLPPPPLTPMQEELVDIDRRLVQRSNSELAKVVLIRFLTNSLTVIVLIVAGVIIFYAAQYSLEVWSPCLPLLFHHYSLPLFS